MEKIIKKSAIVLMALMLVISLTSVSFAYDVNIKNIDSGGILNTNSGAGKTVNDAAQMVIRIFQVVGIAAALIILLFIGIKYMSAAPSEKAEVKKSAVIYIVGAVLLFAAPNVVALIYNFAKGI